jgi:hypothetical protein
VKLERVEVFVTRPGKTGLELLLLTNASLAETRSSSSNFASSNPRSTVAGNVLEGEHPCETAWRLASAALGSAEACISFHKIKSSTTEHERTHVFHSSLEAEHLIDAANPHWSWHPFKPD